MRRLIKYIITLGYRLLNVKRNTHINASAILLKGCHFEGNNAIGDNTYLSKTSFGYGSYTGFGCEFTNCKIGRFCSIGSNIRVVAATHPIAGFVSTHPAFFSDTYRFHYVQSSKFNEHLTNEDGYQCTIGNDVWIGDNVLIKGGCRIGDGAIIGMGSLVLHDVPPYTIVAGVPAKEIRKRFDENTIAFLKEIKWWERPLSWIQSHADEFDDIKVFINNYR